MPSTWKRTEAAPYSKFVNVQTGWQIKQCRKDWGRQPSGWSIHQESGEYVCKVPTLKYAKAKAERLYGKANG
jgi:hypothetical protein